MTWWIVIGFAVDAEGSQVPEWIEQLFFATKEEADACAEGHRANGHLCNVQKIDDTNIL